MLVCRETIACLRVWVCERESKTRERGRDGLKGGCASHPRCISLETTTLVSKQISLCTHIEAVYACRISEFSKTISILVKSKFWKYFSIKNPSLSMFWLWGSLLWNSLRSLERAKCEQRNLTLIEDGSENFHFGISSRSGLCVSIKGLRRPSLQIICTSSAALCFETWAQICLFKFAPTDECDLLPLKFSHS